MNTTCHGCNASAPPGVVFQKERIPFSGTRFYCPKCHAKFEEKLIFGVLALNLSFGPIGFAALWFNPVSEVGHVFANLFLLQLAFFPSVIIHEFAHAFVGKLCGLTILRIWIGAGKTLFRLKILGFDTEFKPVLMSGRTFMTLKSPKHRRFKYFLSVAAGPLANFIVLIIAWKSTSWPNFSLEHSIQLPAFVAFTQILILLENLLPYRRQTAFGLMPTDGLSLVQLSFSKSPDMFNPHLRIPLDSTSRNLKSA